MTSLYVDRRDIHLEMDAGALVFRENGERMGTVPLAPISRVFLRGNVTLQASLLGKLGEQGVGVTVLSGRQGKPSLMLPRAHNDARRRVEQTRLSLDPAFCLRFSQHLIRTKLERQHEWFEQLREQRPQARYALTHAMRLLQSHLQKIDHTGSLDSLRGLEGASASASFAGLRSVVPASLGFNQRNRRPPRDPFNALLSLTYTMAHAETALALHGAGFDPFIGFYHQLSFGRQSLACDLLETVRALADRFCLHLVSSQTITREHFSQNSDACLLGKAGRMHYYSAYEEHADALRRAIGHAVDELTRTIESNMSPASTASSNETDHEGID